MSWGPLLKHIKLVVVMIIAMLLLTGCWDRREIEERISVVGIAIDQSSDNPKLYRLSIQIPIPIKIAGSGGGKGGDGGKSAVKVMSTEGRTVVEAFENLQKRLNQELFYGHTRIIAIGEAVACQGVKEIFDPFRRDPQLRRLLWPVVVKGEAIKLLEASPSLEQIPIVFIMSLIDNGAKAGRIPDMNLGNFYIDLSSKSQEPYLNYIEVNEDDVRWSGLAVFKRDQMVGTLTTEDTCKFMQIQKHKGGGTITFPYHDNPQQLITISLEYINAKDTVSYESGRVVVRKSIFLEGKLLEKTFDSDLSTPQAIKEIESEAENYLNHAAARMISKLQNDYKSDILGIGSKIRSYQPKIWGQLEWRKHDFSEADIQITYVMKIRNSGMEMR